MRICKRCNCEMLEGYSIKGRSVSSGMSKIVLSDGPGTYSKEFGTLKVAVCPKCGELSFYIDEPSKLKK